MRKTKVTLQAVALVATIYGASACSDDSGTTPPKADSAACVPTTCQTVNKDCGTIPDGCGGVLACGSCSAPMSCAGGGVANVCGSGSTCSPTTCAAENKTCGTISDGCADVLSCGSCTAPEVCGGAGTANVCGKPPEVPSPDAGKPTPGQCSGSCMEQSGAGCCTTCGCADITVKCYPVCEVGKWDCEMGCCFDYQALKCV